MSCCHHVHQQLDKIEHLLKRLLAKETETMALIDDLLADVADESTVSDSIIALLTNIKAQLDASGTPPATLAQIQSAIDAVTANKTKLAAAIVANTPTAATPPTP